MKRKVAFTLIELLVVIAIIAILAAILFPVFAQAKNSAKKAVSTSNARNIGMGVMMYLTDYDDKLPMLQYVDPPNPYTWHGWPEMVGPYIKNGNGKDPAGGWELWGFEGIFRSPGDSTKQRNGSYAMHQDLMRDGSAPWNGYSIPPVFSPTNIDMLAEKVLCIERGINLGYANWLQFAAWEWDWTDWLDWDRTNWVPRRTGINRSIEPNHGDCDLAYYEPPSGQTETPESWNMWASCGMFPRYRYNNAVPFIFLDGHAAAWTRSKTGTKVDWAKNIYIREAAQFDSAWYPY
ncbi:MAG: prepilin-type N-terminal cleavage/methylation domain-containing protein [Armatimonadetes bacterium]|nr:prepilin-type N-terminal cleavage/methylation domain-containing protein [Armatimonadota bacterium]